MLIKTAPIAQLVDDLAEENVTTYMLEALDFVVPNEWENLTGFDNTIQAITGVNDPAQVATIGQQASALYADPEQNFQKALWLYQAVDLTDRVLAATALANKISQKIGFLSIVNKLTPKSDTVQSIDLGMKLVVEALAYGFLRGLPSEGVGQFVSSLADYGQENIMRMAALVCVDGLVPLGPDFIDKTGAVLRRARPGDLRGNAIYQKMGDLIPGQTEGEQLGFIQETFGSASAWLDNFQRSRNINRQTILANLGRVIDLADNTLDYVGAFLDATTSYYAHTGTQTVARRVIEVAGGQTA